MSKPSWTVTVKKDGKTAFSMSFDRYKKAQEFSDFWNKRHDLPGHAEIIKVESKGAAK